MRQGKGNFWVFSRGQGGRLGQQRSILQWRRLQHPRPDFLAFPHAGKQDLEGYSTQCLFGSLWGLSGSVSISNRYSFLPYKLWLLTKHVPLHWSLQPDHVPSSPCKGCGHVTDVQLMACGWKSCPSLWLRCEKLPCATLPASSSSVTWMLTAVVPWKSCVEDGRARLCLGKETRLC